jgi:hypothetical protein
MSINTTTFKDKVTPKLHGTKLAKVSAFYEKMREASGKMRLRSKSPTLMRRSRIENAIYSHIYNYTCPDWLEDGDIVDIRPLAQRSTQDEIKGVFVRDFDIKKETDTATVEYINGQKTLRLSKQIASSIVIHRMESTTLDGTVTLGGDASNASIDTLDYISGNGALKFDLDGLTGQATITIALDSAKDLSDLLDIGALTEWLQFPDVSRLTSVDLAWGSSASKYWNKTATAAHDRSFAEAGDAGWMLLRHDWVDASETGSPVEADAEAIDYIKITLNYTTGTALSNVKMDNIMAAKGEAWEVVGYSNQMFTDSTGTTWKSVPTDDTDLIQLNDMGLNIFLYEFMLTLQQEIKGKNATIDYKFFKDELYYNRPSLYDAFNEQYPDQALIREQTYHEFDDLDGMGN